MSDIRQRQGGRLVEVALTIACDIREIDPAEIKDRIAGLSRPDVDKVVWILAEMVDVEKPVSELLAWQGRPSRPRRPPSVPCATCGTDTAGFPHKKAYCTPACRLQARRESWRAAKERKRAAS